MEAALHSPETIRTALVLERLAPLRGQRGRFFSDLASFGTWSASSRHDFVGSDDEPTDPFPLLNLPDPVTYVDPHAEEPRVIYVEVGGRPQEWSCMPDCLLLGRACGLLLQEAPTRGSAPDVCVRGSSLPPAPMPGAGEPLISPRGETDVSTADTL